jgi:hypothetical protein
MTQSPAKFIDRWFDLAPLGFPGWEHNTAFRATTGNSAGLCVEVRMIGCDFSVRLFGSGRGLFDAIEQHIEKTEALIAKQARVAA